MCSEESHGYLVRVTRESLSLVTNGDLVVTIRSMLRVRCYDTVEVLDWNDGADAAADPGRLSHSDDAISSQHALHRTRRHFFPPIMMDLHKFMVAVSRTAVNHDGNEGTRSRR